MTDQMQLEADMPQPPQKRASRHPTYEEAGLWTVHSFAFVDDPEFKRAYDRAARAAGRIPSWRAHVALWCASVAARLDGDFVECGVNRGFLSTAIMTYLDWNKLGKHFYLLDTWAGIDERYLTDSERAHNLTEAKYNQDVEAVRRNFAEWERVHIIQGTVPDTLPQVGAEKVAYLHLDMNVALPERAAAEYFWDKIVPGGVLLMDDYAHFKHAEQRLILDEFAASKGVRILYIPTCQGLIIKPGA